MIPVAATPVRLQRCTVCWVCAIVPSIFAPSTQTLNLSSYLLGEIHDIQRSGGLISLHELSIKQKLQSASSISHCQNFTVLLGSRFKKKQGNTWLLQYSAIQQLDLLRGLGPKVRDTVTSQIVSKLKLR